MSQGRIADILQENWPRRGLIAWLLLPLSLIYGTLLRIRRLAYQWGALKSSRVRPVVIVVGNVIVGGAGKTPTTIRIVKQLLAQHLAVGVVSRGYGRSSQTPCVVGTGHTAAEVGDEPLLIHTATGVPTAVAPRRLDAAQLLLRTHPNLQVLVCDDGLQHYALHRDVEVCVFDDRGLGNGWLLPAGPLREPWPLQPVLPAGQTGDGPLLLNTGGDATRGLISEPGGEPQRRWFQAHRKLMHKAIAGTGETLDLRKDLPTDRPIAAIAGIARPEIFFAMLREIGVPLALTVALPDHAKLDAAQLEPYKHHLLLCTEKDAGKIWPLQPQAFAVPLHLDIAPAFFEALNQQVQSALSTKLSSPHGHTTT